MGTLTSSTDHSGMKVGKVTLGAPARELDKDDLPDGDFRWDDPHLPDGTITADGTIIMNEEGVS